MKTIFITSFHQLISRNILSTPILDLLLEDERVRVVILFVGNEVKRRFFECEFSRPGVVIEGIPRRVTRREELLCHLSLAALKTRALAIKRRVELVGRGRWLTAFIGNRGVFRRLIRRFDALLAPRDLGWLFGRYNPDLVFATDVQNVHDVRLVHEARRRGVRVIGMVRSWDNLTSKGLIRVVPDTLVVHNNIIKQEAITLHGIPPARIVVTGIPHYDSYLTEKRSTRVEFFKRLGGDPNRRLALFTPTGDRYLQDNTVDREVLEIMRDTLTPEYQILVRCPPQDTVNFDGFENDGRVIFERPTIPQTAIPRKTELTRDLDRHLADTLYHSVLVVSGPSTISIDAAVFDKPIILIGFDGMHPRPYYESIRRFFDYEHQQSVLSSGGARLAMTVGKFQEFVRVYLVDSSRDAAGRRTLVREQCFALDGKSSQRVVAVLLTYLFPAESHPLFSGAASQALGRRITKSLVP